MAIEGSSDKRTWTPLAAGSTSVSGRWQVAAFDATARYLRFRFQTPGSATALGCLAEAETWGSGVSPADAPTETPTAIPTETPTAIPTETPTATVTATPPVIPTATVAGPAPPTEVPALPTETPEAVLSPSAATERAG